MDSVPRHYQQVVGHALKQAFNSIYWIQVKKGWDWVELPDGSFQFHLLDSLGPLDLEEYFIVVPPLSIPFIGFEEYVSYLVSLGMRRDFQFHLLDSFGWLKKPLHLNSIDLSIPFIGFPCLAMALWFPLRIRNSVQYYSD